MDKSFILLFLGILIFIITIFYLIKIFIINKRIAHKLIDNHSSFSNIEEVPKIVDFFKNNTKYHDNTITKISFNNEVYIADVLKKIKKGKSGNTVTYSTMLVKEIETGLPELLIRKKMSGFLEAMEKMASKDTFHIKTNNEDFDNDYVFYSKEKVKLPETLIKTLIDNKETFPFTNDSEYFNTVLFINENGYAITCDRVLEKENLNSLVENFSNLTFR